MTIKYKFNKSSEARDCVVESVRLYYHNEYVYSKEEKEVINRYIEFESQQRLKEYINTIQEPIEFIAESDIDQVLMKEWIGEWEIENRCDFMYCKNDKNNCILFNDCEQYTMKTGSPKLNSNWVFKIK